MPVFMRDSVDYRINRKNFRVPETRLVTAYCPLTITGLEELVVQTGETRFVVDCKVKPAALVGHVKITFAPDGMTVSCGALTGNEMLNTVPWPELPPFSVVPYRMLADKIKG